MATDSLVCVLRRQQFSQGLSIAGLFHECGLIECRPRIKLFFGGQLFASQAMSLVLATT